MPGGGWSSPASERMTVFLCVFFLAAVSLFNKEAKPRKKRQMSVLAAPVGLARFFFFGGFFLLCGVNVAARACPRFRLPAHLTHLPESAELGHAHTPADAWVCTWLMEFWEECHLLLPHPPPPRSGSVSPPARDLDGHVKGGSCSLRRAYSAGHQGYGGWLRLRYCTLIDDITRLKPKKQNKTVIVDSKALNFSQKKSSGDFALMLELKILEGSRFYRIATTAACSSPRLSLAALRDGGNVGDV